MKTLRRTAASLALFSSLMFASASADVLTLNPTADAYIRASQNSTQTGNFNNTINYVGDTTNASDYLRSLFSFDLTSPVLNGATITGVTLTLKIQSADTGSSANQDVALNLYALTTFFSEGATTWTARTSTTAWTTPGGDYSALLASTTANAATAIAGQSVLFSDSSLTSIASSLVGSSLNLLVKLANEDSTQRNIFRFGTINTPTYIPVLTINYTPSAVPEPSTYALLGGAAVLAFVAIRRRSRRA